jgi:hypothetical protein
MYAILKLYYDDGAPMSGETYKMSLNESGGQNILYSSSLGPREAETSLKGIWIRAECRKREDKEAPL